MPLRVVIFGVVKYFDIFEQSVLTTQFEYVKLYLNVGDNNRRFTVHNEVDLTFTPTKMLFVLEPNWAGGLSSYSGDYVPRSEIRGFSLVCSFGKNECEYGFVLLTDPCIIMTVVE